MQRKYTKVIVCLANSRKTTGRCLAGKEISGPTSGIWIRPISARPNGELSEEDRRFENGQDPKLLDVIRVPMLEPRPHGYQSENHLIDDGYYWVKERTATWAEITKILDVVQGPLWDNSSSSNNGEHDRVIEGTAAGLNDSLKLIEVDLPLNFHPAAVRASANVTPFGAVSVPA